MKRVTWSLSLLVLGLTGCGASDASIHLSTSNAVIRDEQQVRVLTDVDLAALQATTEENTLILRSDAPALSGLAAKDILVADANSITQNGLLQRVLSLEPRGDVTVLHTEPAALEDVFYSMHVEGQIPVTDDGNTSLASHLDGVEIGTSQAPLKGGGSYALAPIDLALKEVVVVDADNNPATTTDQLRVTGRVTLSPTFDVSIDIGFGTLREFSFTNTDTLRTELALNGSAQFPVIEKSLPVASLRLAPITVMVGPVPVVLVPTASVNLIVSVTAGGTLTTSVTAQTQFKVGFRYDRGDWSLIQSFPNSLSDITFSYELPKVTANATATAQAQAKASVLFYGVAGPFATLSGLGRARVDMTQGRGNWTLSSGLVAGAGVEASLFRKQLVYKTPEFRREWEIAKGSF